MDVEVDGTNQRQKEFRKQNMYNYLSLKLCFQFRLCIHLTMHLEENKIKTGHLASMLTSKKKAQK